HGLPEQVRAPREDGVTTYLRPLPGRARMYPETDSMPFKITSELIDEIDRTEIEKPEDRIQRLKDSYGLSDTLVQNLYLHPRFALFEEITNEYDIDPKLVASTLIEKITYLRRQGIPEEAIDNTTLKEIFSYISNKKISKSAIDLILEYKGKHPNMSVEAIINEQNFSLLSKEEVLSIIKAVIEEKRTLIEHDGMRSMGIIISEIMSRIKGRADGRVVSQLVREFLQSIITK
ncbi:MAG: GatB/YqeY domain-containing protein, partial [Candidatus Heimdallarchaeaceae archaeon]